MVITLTDKVRFYESVFGPGRMPRNCRNFDVKCPICDPKDPDKKKLAILVADDRCHCWSCGYRSLTLAPLIKRFGTRAQLLEYRDRFMPVFDRFWDDEDDVGAKQRPVLPKDFRLLCTSRTRDPDVQAVKRYVQNDRGLTDDDLWYFKIGYSNDPRWFRRAIMPSFDKEGTLNHYVGRAIDRRVKPKYDSPEGDRRQVIFNEINIDWTTQLVICEGSFDVVKCGANAVPLLGSDINEESALFNSIVVNNTPIALALDSDMRLTKMPRVARKLMDYAIDVVIVDVDTDPGDMSKAQFKEALRAARPFDWERSFFDRLERASRISL